MIAGLGLGERTALHALALQQGRGRRLRLDKQCRVCVLWTGVCARQRRTQNVLLEVLINPGGAAAGPAQVAQR